MPDPTLNTFPTFTEGITSIAWGPFKYARAGVDVRFENGWLATRVLDHAGRWREFTVTMILNPTDYQTVLDFLTGQELRNIPFNFTHRHLGEAIARYGAWELPVAVAIEGNPAWYRLELPMEGMF